VVNTAMAERQWTLAFSYTDVKPSTARVTAVNAERQWKPKHENLGSSDFELVVNAVNAERQWRLVAVDPDRGDTAVVMDAVNDERQWRLPEGLESTPRQDVSGERGERRKAMETPRPCLACAKKGTFVVNAENAESQWRRDDSVVVDFLCFEW